MAEDGYKVKLNVYDLSQGLARQLSTSFLGKAVEAIWHTGVVAYGNEYYFGGGIQCDPAGMTPYGTPIRVVDIGVTHVPKEVFEEYLHEIGPRYTAETYNLLSHNCNNFSNEVVQFLVGAGIPDYILQLPNEVMSSPMGALILPMIQRLETTLRSGAVPQAPQFVPPPAAPPSIPKNIASNPPNNKSSVQSDGQEADSGSSPSEVQDSRVAVPPPLKAASVSEEKKPPVSDPLGDARGRVQEEITREFAAIMATGTLRASEAAALAARRVMERHGLLNLPMQQS
ncbi:desumoylating isopeptidase 1-like [Phoenix dactylifera]|uniref:Desumoylating isopeptidase 1-like n=1 Tax=Phoenix dactylifera TaxID=42345 RepID=A0A8B7CMM7_PHODC|nr:desumoylating isopeptidase 1-like [Phoenix dactylifera]